jgi:hypothetical protein
MPAKTDTPVVGSVFGRFTVIGEPFRVGHTLKLPVKCSCGTEKYVDKTNLLKGASRSCGCLNREVVVARCRKYPPETKATYYIWHAMVSRCTNPKNPSYHNYGERGITVSRAWKNFENFLADMGIAPKGLTLERVKNNLGYSKKNCVWATRHDNLMNKRTTVRVEFQGHALTLPQLSRLCSVPWKNLYQRIFAYGWSVEKAVATPLRFKSKNGEAVWDRQEGK